MSRSASLAQCVLRKRSSVSPPCSWDSHPGLHSSTADSAVPDNCASSLGPQRYRSCILVPSTYCRARLAYEKYVSASPSHPRMRVDRCPASLVMYFRESSFFSKADSSPPRFHPCACHKTDDYVPMYKSIVRKGVRAATSVGHQQSVSLMYMYRKSRLMTNSLFLTTRDRYF